MLFAIGAAALWSTVPVGTRLLVRNGGAFSVAFLSAARLLMASVVFIGAQLFYTRRANEPLRRPLRRAGWLLLAAAGIFLNYVLYGLGLRYTTAGATAVVSQVNACLTVLLAALLLDERLTRRKLLGMLIALSGVLMVVFQPGAARELLTPGHLYGNLIEIAAAMAWPFYAIGQTKLLENSDDQQVLMRIFVLASGFSLLLLPFSGPMILRAPTVQDWLYLIFLGLGSTAAAYWLFALAVRHLQTSESAMFNVFIPVLALLLGHWLLAEPIHGHDIAGLLLVITGLVLIIRQRQDNRRR